MIKVDLKPQTFAGKTTKPSVTRNPLKDGEKILLPTGLIIHFARYMEPEMQD
jgi:Holliday junction resolvasome RuvABC ATP-dependent DNA helicase subunit